LGDRYRSIDLFDITDEHACHGQRTSSGSCAINFAMIIWGAPDT
jgi:hypothetical protein